MAACRSSPAATSFGARVGATYVVSRKTRGSSGSLPTTWPVTVARKVMLSSSSRLRVPVPLDCVTLQLKTMDRNIENPTDIPNFFFSENLMAYLLCQFALDAYLTY